MKYVFPEYKENVVLGNGKLQLNPMSYQVIYEGKEIDLTPREFEVLYLLALKPNWVMPKTTIYHSVWGIHYHDDQIPYRTVEYKQYLKWCFIFYSFLRTGDGTILTVPCFLYYTQKTHSPQWYPKKI